MEHIELWLWILGFFQAVVFLLGGAMFRMAWSIVNELRRTNERQETRINALEVNITKTETSTAAIMARFDRFESKIDKQIEKLLDSKRGG